MSYDPIVAEKSFDGLAGARAALGDDVPPAPRLDMGMVAVLGVRIARELADRETRPRFANIEAELPAETVDCIGPAAWALWYATVQRATATASASMAMLPADLVERATALRATMLKVVEYHLDEDRAAAAEIADIIRGTGYADLASDLQRLARLYRAHRNDLGRDAKHYVREHEKVAGATAAEIVSTLAAYEPDAHKKWSEAVDRSFAVLNEAYGRVRAFAHAIFGEDDERFPSLFSVRANPTRPSPDEPTTPAL